MKEKRTFVEFVKENKKKIIIGVGIAGVVAAGLAITLLTGRGEEHILDGLQDLLSDSIVDMDIIGEAA